MSGRYLETYSLEKKNPVICVPLVGKDEIAVLQEVSSAAVKQADVVEWRVDAFSQDTLTFLEKLRKQLQDKPLLFTFRSKVEGGLAEISPEEYRALLLKAIESGNLQYVDVEFSQGETVIRTISEAAKKRNVKVVVSKHDFFHTPSESEMVSLLKSMKAAGADYPKLAVMPESMEDVSAVFSATLKAYRAVGPVITMAMGSLGQITRAGGGCFGSCLTFGAGEQASAPGQMPVSQLKNMIEALQA